MLGLIPFLFKGKRMPPTKTRPLRQGSKKPLLDEDPRATEKVSAGAAPNESKSPGRAGGQGSGAAPLLPHLAQKGTVSFEGNFLGTKQPFSDHWAEELPKHPPPDLSGAKQLSPASPPLPTSCLAGWAAEGQVQRLWHSQPGGRVTGPGPSPTSS